MAFLKTAQARVVRPHVQRNEWSSIRVAGKVAQQDGGLNANLVERASEFFSKPFNPNDYLLTHATIIASVDVYEPAGVKMGSTIEDGFRVNRRYSDYRIKAEADKFINNNMDAWNRRVLLASYPTFIGGHNFVEHVQVEDLSKGRIIDAVARDIGESIYVDILIATDRKHRDLVAAIENGKMGTLSMGCFLPGTQVTMADGRRIAIEDVQPGDMVLTHKGRAREVLNKQIRGGQWGIRKIQAVGVPNSIEATDNHPFFVFRQPNICACGCGEALPEYKGGRKNATRGLNRRFLRGHDKRILNPNNTYSMQEYQERKARLEAIQAGDGQWVRADDLRVGDFVCFPRVQAEGTDISKGKARLLGYFLAEGSFQKYKGERSAVEFSFSMDEKDTFVAEVVQLLRQEFPGKEPTVNPHLNRNVCSVRLGDRQAAQWFYTHGGEYGNGKRLSPDVMNWTAENHKHLIGAWLNGDGGCGRQYSNQSTAGVTTSYDLACQMHMLMARCGWFARLECKVGARSVALQEVINGGFVRDEVSGRLPSFTLVIGKVSAQTLVPYTVKVAPEPGFQTQGPRVRDDMVMFPVTSIVADTYDGWVHNMEVAEDNSYVVSGICSHNCTVDGTICTKCGHWAADETEMCPHIKYMKGNSFFDEQGRRHRIAELCGHESIGPTGGVHFIEASWVGTPAFTGAVLRNVIAPTEAVSEQAAKILATPPTRWSGKATMKAAGGDRVISKSFTPAQQKLPEGWDEAAGRRASLVMEDVIARVPAVRQAEEAFLAGWMDEGGGDAPPAEGDAEGAPAPPPPKPESSFSDLEEEVRKHVLDRVKKRLTDELTKPENPEGASENETLNKLASTRKYAAGLLAIIKTATSDADLINRVASFNQQSGIDIPVRLYRASLKLGSYNQYKSAQEFWAACERVLGDKPRAREARVLFRLSKLLSQGACLGRSGYRRQPPPPEE
jgi:hypothetical protein